MSNTVDAAVTELVEGMVSGAVESAIDDLDFTEKVESALDYSVDLETKVRDVFDVTSEVQAVIESEDFAKQADIDESVRDAVEELAQLTSRAFQFVYEATSTGVNVKPEWLDFHKVRRLFMAAKAVLVAHVGIDRTGHTQTPLAEALEDMLEVIDRGIWEDRQKAAEDTAEVKETNG